MSFRISPRFFRSHRVLSIGAVLALGAFSSHGLAQSKAPRAPQPAWTFLEDEAEPQFTLSCDVKSAAQGTARLIFDYRDAKNFYVLELAPQSAQLSATIKGKSRVLDRANIALADGATTPVFIKRRGWVMEIIIGGKTVLTGYDAALNDGKIGHAVSGGWSVSQARVQPVEEIYFTDDFTRLPGENAEWKPEGNWQLTSSSEESAAIYNRHHDAKQRIAMSANPFAFRASAKSATNFATSGRWFWDSYDAQVSVKPLGRGTVGIAVYVQDAKNYLAFLWDAEEGPRARRLVRVQDGRETVLASARGAFLPRQWYRLSLRTSPGYLEAFIDGAPALSIQNNDFGQGGVALLARNIEVADFDDARVQSYANYRQNFENIGSAWSGQGGAWNARAGVLASTGAKGKNDARFLVTGRGGWDGYTLSSRAKIGTSGAAGLAVGYKNSGNFTVFRFAAKNSALPFRGRQQLVRLRDGKAQIVSDEPLSLSTQKDGYVPVSVRLKSGTVAAFSGEKLLAQMVDDTLSVGRPALWAQGEPTVMFRDVDVAFPVAPVPQRVPTKMADDALMVGWASQAGEWPPTNAESGIEYWNTGEFFGDASLSYPWKRSSYIGGKMEWALRAARGKFDSGLVARYEDVRDKNALRITLLQGGKTLKTADFDWEKIAPKSGDETSKPVPLRVQMEGRGLLFFVNGKPVMSFVAPNLSTQGSAEVQANAEVQKTSLAARSSGFRLSARDLQAGSANRDDYTFNDAPVDWYAPQGEWSVISRWPCYADWSFFGGSGLAPMLWSKREYSGDTVVDYYAHNQMDLPKEPGYATPGDLNVTLFGDGRDLTSGYSFVVAGWNNTRTQLYKGGKMVAETREPAALFQRTTNGNPQFHNRWYSIRAQARRATRDGKKGVLLRLVLDDAPVLEYFDDAPLAAFQKGGRVAFWTRDSVTLIARAKIESERLKTRALPAGLINAENAAPMMASTRGADLMPVSESEAGRTAALIEREENGSNVPQWTVTNAESGGSFLVRLGGENTRVLSPNARLEWEANIPSNVKITLYARADGELYSIALNDEKRPDARVTSLGEATRQSLGDGWTRYSFPLGASLLRQGTLRLDALQLGALTGRDYLWAGFGGNTMGSRYQLRNARLMN